MRKNWLLLQLTFVVTGFLIVLALRDEKALRWRDSLVTVCQVNNRGKLCVSATAKHLCAPLEFPRGESIKFYKERVQNRAQLSHTQHLHRAGDIIWPWVIPSLIYLLGSNIQVPACEAPTIKHGFGRRMSKNSASSNLFLEKCDKEFILERHD